MAEGGLSELTHSECLAQGLTHRKPSVSEAVIMTDLAAIVSTQLVTDPSF